MPRCDGCDCYHFIDENSGRCCSQPPQRHVPHSHSQVAARIVGADEYCVGGYIDANDANAKNSHPAGTGIGDTQPATPGVYNVVVVENSVDVLEITAVIPSVITAPKTRPKWTRGRWTGSEWQDLEGAALTVVRWATGRISD